MLQLPNSNLPTKYAPALHLLVVEDDPVQRRIITRSAHRIGFSISEAASCGEGIQHIREQRFDCVTLDLLLGDGDGFEILKTMSDAGYQGPVIVISGRDRFQRHASRMMSKSYGIDLIQSFPKPIDLSAFRAALVRLSHKPIVRELDFINIPGHA